MPPFRGRTVSDRPRRHWVKVWRTLPRERYWRRASLAARSVWIALYLAPESLDGQAAPGGIPLTPEDVADEAGVTVDEAVAALAYWQEVEWLARAEDGCLVIVGYEAQQETPSAARMRRLRDRQRPDSPPEDTEEQKNRRTEEQSSASHEANSDRHSDAEEPGPAPRPPDGLVEIPCRAPGPSSWWLTEKVRADIAELYPGVDVAAVAEDMRKKIKAGARDPATHRGTRKALAAWCAQEAKRPTPPSLGSRRGPDMQVGATTAPTADGWMYESYRASDYEQHRSEPDWPAYIEAATDYPRRGAPTFSKWQATKDNGHGMAAEWAAEG